MPLGRMDDGSTVGGKPRRLRPKIVELPADENTINAKVVVVVTRVMTRTTELAKLSDIEKFIDVVTERVFFGRLLRCVQRIVKIMAKGECTTDLHGVNQTTVP